MQAQEQVQAQGRVLREPERVQAQEPEPGLLRARVRQEPVRYQQAAYSPQGERVRACPLCLSCWLRVRALRLQRGSEIVQRLGEFWGVDGYVDFKHGYSSSFSPALQGLSSCTRSI